MHTGKDQRTTPTRTRKSQLNILINLGYVALTPNVSALARLVEDMILRDLRQTAFDDGKNEELL
jgi:hypothetical protein